MLALEPRLAAVEARLILQEERFEACMGMQIQLAEMRTNIEWLRDRQERLDASP